MASAATSTEESATESTEASDATSVDSSASAPSSSAGSVPESTKVSEKPAMTVEDSIQLSESFGGPHGTNFSDQNFVNSGQTVSEISIHAGERLDGITMEISAPKTLTFTHGGTGGEQKTLKLGQGEYITSMEVHWNKNTVGTVITKDRTRIFYINFLTSAGNSLAGGTMTEQKMTVTAPEGFQLAGFFGREGKEIDSLGAIWAAIDLVTPPPKPSPTPVPTIESASGSAASTETSGSGSMAVFIPKNTQPVQLSESFGGPHGKQFSDQLAVTSGMTVSSVTIRGGERLDGVTLEVSSPKKMTFTHGGTGGDEKTLELEAGEYITSIEAHLDKKRGATRVFYLSLNTSKGNSISAGTQTEIKGSAQAPEGYQLVGFFGRFGDEIDLIGAVWASIAAVNETVSAPVPADEDIALSAVYGGPHGIAFSDIAKIALGQTLTSISPRSGERLNAITVGVSDPPGLTFNHGGAGGEETTLTLAPGEYINSMEIHWGKRRGRTRVFFVNFGTSEGKSISAGTKTEQNAKETAPEGFQLSGFFGRGEDEIYQLGAIWTRIEAKPLLLTDAMGTAWHGKIIRNWVGPTIGTPKDTACYRKTRPMDSKNVCPLGYGRDDDDCIVQCPMAYPVECLLECIPQNENCAMAVLSKIAAVAGVAFNAATAGVFGNVKTAYKGAKRVYMCAANVISVIKSLIYFFRFVQKTAPQGDTEKLLAVAYQSNVVLIDLPIAIYACMGKPAPPNMVWSGYALMTVQFIVKQTIINGDKIISSAKNVIDLIKNSTAQANSASSVTEVEDFIAANTSCGYELKKLTDRVIYAVNNVRNKTPNAAVDDIRVKISRSALVQHDIPRVTNNCMREMMVNKTKQAAFENRDLLRKTMGVIIDQLIDTSTTDMGKYVAEKEYMMEVTNFGLAVLGGLDPTGIMWMVSQFVQPICGPTSFIGEIDDGNLYDALGMWTVDEAFVGSYGSWTKKGDGVVSLIFESIDTEDVTVVISSGGDEYAKVDVGSGDTVKWSSTVSELQAKTLYLDRWRPGLFGLPGSGGGSLLLWVPQAAEAIILAEDRRKVTVNRNVLETFQAPIMIKSPLLEWITAHESSVTVAQDLINPVSSVASYGVDDRSIVAQSEIQTDAELVTLHSGAFLNGSYWLDHYDESDKLKLQEQIRTMQLSGTVKTTLALLAELAQGVKSEFYGYIQQLPTTISLPFSWDEKRREMLKHTTAFPILDDKLVTKFYADYVSPLAKEFPTIWPTDMSTLEKFQWAYSMVSSRAFKVANTQEPTLLPVIDMANHTVEKPAAHIVKTDSGSFQLIALRKVEKNEPVTISYGELSNAQLLCRYGFVLPTVVSSDSIHITSSELLNAFKACTQNSEDEEDEDDPPQIGKGKGKAKANPAKRRKLAHPENDDNSLFFSLHGDADQEFGLGDALLSFVMASNLPAEQLYDVLAVVLQEKDKHYSDLLSASDNGSSEMSAIHQLCQLERQVCRRILLGLMSLEEGSDSSDDEE
ncbi:Hypothetical protein PHPALM_6610 [Phytophthora palmivora]|uniref:Jacalin-type lectin domain-containing protein n=1 Tax=Phytophthora palmivora TaxID=4796 RepID=A0A2P4YED5_9STRA|nr:Hypothetical protein PHPALM_6610 [Phytophthora palmivora]